MAPNLSSNNGWHLTNLWRHVAPKIFKGFGKPFFRPARLPVKGVAGQPVVAAALHVDRDEVDAAFAVIEQTVGHL